MFNPVDALIIGGGVIGSSVAMHLASMGMQRVRVVDFDLEGSLSSSELNAGGVRATWKEPLHIEMSKLSIDYFSQNAQDVGYRPCGYLWLHSDQTWEKALKAKTNQTARGWPVEVWDEKELRRRVPFIDKTEGIRGVLFAPRDGLINPNLLKNHFRKHAKTLGVVFDDRTRVRSVQYPKAGTSPIQVVAERFESVMSYETRLDVLSAPADRSFGRTQVEYQATYVINCAGAWASQIAQLLGYHSPSFAVRRQISVFDSREVDLTPYGMIVDTSGVYFHPEASNGLAGFASPSEPRGVNYTYEGEEFFQNWIWPALYERSTHFEKLKHLTGWAGLYEMSPDEGALLGQVANGEAGKTGRVFEAHSFSGHGVMHSYAAGLVLAEKIIKGRYETLDADLLAGERFEPEKGRRLVQENLII